MSLVDMGDTTGKDEWSTPQWLFDYLNKFFSFDIDVCASHLNHKCEKYFTIDDDSMHQDWVGNTFCNPPYSAKKNGSSYGLLAWCEKNHREFRSFGGAKVLLIPADTSTKYFEFCYENAAVIEFLSPRIKFGGSNQSPKFGSMLVTFSVPIMKLTQKVFVLNLKHIIKKSQNERK